MKIIFTVSLFFISFFASAQIREVKTTYPGGEVKEVFHVNTSGEKEGTYLFFFQNGRKQIEQNYKNGLKHGKSYLWFENGVVAEEAEYINGIRTGILKSYDEQGNKLEEIRTAEK